MVDNFVGVDAVALGGEVYHDAVPQHRPGEGLNVVSGDMGATAEQGPRFAAQNEELHCADSSAPAELIADKIGHAGLADAGLPHQREGVTHNVIGGWHFSHGTLKFENLFG